jgi:hypothetical protein
MAQIICPCVWIEILKKMVEIKNLVLNVIYVIFIEYAMWQHDWRAPKFFVGPKKGSNYVKERKWLEFGAAPN